MNSIRKGWAFTGTAVFSVFFAALIGFHPWDAGPVWGAEPGGRLTLSQALSLGDRNWLMAEEFGEAGRFHRQREREAWRRRYLPSLTLAATRTEGDLQAFEAESQLEARMEYLLYAGGREGAGHQAALSAGEAGRMEEGEAKEDNRLQVAEAFFQLVSSSRRLESLRLAVEQAEREHAGMRRRRELGLRTQLEVMQAKLLLEDERFNMADEERTRAENALTLSHLIRIPVPSGVELVSDLITEPAPKPVGFYTQAGLRNHKGLARLERELETIGEEMRRVEASDYPELLLTTAVTDPKGEDRIYSVGLSLVYRFGGHKTSFDQENTQGTFAEQDFSLAGSDVVETERIVKRNKSTSRLGITFFDFADPTADQASRQIQARMEFAEGRRVLTEGREARTRDILTRYHRLQSALERLEVESLRVRKDTMERDAYIRSYQGGSVPYEDLLERQTALIRSRLGEITARVDVLLAWAGLLNGSGLPLVVSP